MSVNSSTTTTNLVSQHKLPPLSASTSSRAHEVSLRSFEKCVYAERKSKRKAIAEELLGKAAPWVKQQNNWRQFAQMHCPGIILETTLGGGAEHISAESSLNFVNSCLSGEGLFFSSPSIKKDTYLKLQTALTKYIELFHARPPLTDGLTSKETLEEATDFWLQEIKQSLSSDNPRIYLPLGYRHGTANQGHAIVCKVEEDPKSQDNVLVSLFNLGNGSSAHPTLNYTLDQRKTSFSSLPIAIPKRLFFGEQGRTAFCHLLRYMADAPSKDLCHYDGHDVYDIFFQFLLDAGEIRPLPRQSEYEADLQKSCNCTEIAIRCMMEDALIVADISKEEREKFFLTREFYSLRAHTLAFSKNPSCHPSARDLLLDAEKAFGASVSRMHKKKQITEQEWIGASAVAHEVVQTVRKTPQHDSVRPYIPPPSTTNHNLFQAVAPTSTIIGHRSYDPVLSLKREQFDPPRFCSKTLSSDIKSWIKTAESLSSWFVLDYVSDCIAALPIPKSRDRSSKNDPWNEVAPPQVLDILNDLRKLLRLGLQQTVGLGGRGECEYIEQFLMIYTVYAIADKLARASPENKLDGFSCPFLPFPYEFEPYGFTSLPIRQDSERYTQIFEYMTGKKYQRDPGYNDKTIFPVEPILKVGKYVQEMLSGVSTNENLQGKNHVEYLTKLLPPSTDEAYLSMHFTEKWMSILSPEVQHLYYFSFLSNLLLTTRGHSVPTLGFSKTTESGRVALKIDAPFFDESFTPGDFLSRDLKPKVDKPIHNTCFVWRENSDAVGLHELTTSEKRKLTTNEAISYLLSEKERKECMLDEPAMRTVLYDTRNDNLSLWQALQDFSGIENHHLLGHPGVQNALCSCFFRPRFLLERMREEPEQLTKAFRAFAINGLKNFNDNPAQRFAILFLIRMGVSFEGYTEKGASREETLTFYRKTLLKLLKEPLKEEELGNIEAHVQFLDLQSDQTNPEDFFAGIFEYKFKYKAHFAQGWLGHHVMKMRRQAAYKYADYLSDETKRSALCNRIISTLITDPETLAKLSLSKWEGSFPEFRCGDLSIDFFHTSIKNHKYNATLGGNFSHRHDALEGVPVSKYGSLFWHTQKAMISLNGKLKWDSQTGEWTETVRGTNGQEQEATVVRFHGGKEQQDLNQGFLGDPWQEHLWLAHYRQADGSIISHDMKTNKPYLLRETQGNSVVYSLLSDDGKKLPFTLANLSNVDPDHYLFPYTVQYLPPSNIMCFVDESMKRIQEINFYKLKIQFLHDGKGLSWTKDPGFYLIGSEKDLTTSEEKKAYADLMEEINSYKGAMILYNPGTKKWNVLFPISFFSEISQYGEDFSRDIRPSVKGKFAAEYFHFAFDPLEKTIKVASADQDRANAYLAVLFKMQRSYEKAFHYLNKVKTSSFFDEKLTSILEKFFELPDFSQESVAFNLRLCLFIIRNKNLMLEQRFYRSKLSYFNSSCLNWAIKNYYHYLCDDGASKTPQALHLSDGDKMKLLLSFRNSYQDQYSENGVNLSWEEKWKEEHPVLFNQYNAYFRKTRENTLLPAEQKIPLFPPIFSRVKHFLSQFYLSGDEIGNVVSSYEEYHAALEKGEIEELEIPPYPIRTTEASMIVHLPQLYEEAKQCKPGICPFDFKLHAFLKCKNSRKPELANMLFWVRHFPELFESYPLSSPPTREELTKISSCVREIPNLSPKKYGDFLEKNHKTAPFKIDHPILLSANAEKAKNQKIALAKPATLSMDLNDTEKQILRLFNSPYKVRGGALSSEDLEREMSFELMKDCAQTLSFPKKGLFNVKTQDKRLMETLMKEVILKNNLRYLYKHRPMMNADEMNELCWLTNEWYHARVLQKLKDEGKEDLYLPYDYQKYPEISYFYLKTGKFPRKNQLDVYVWIMENLAKGIKVHYQLGAGDGKTDVLGPLLNLGAKRLNLLPVHCVTQSIYPVDKENLSYNLKMLDEDLYYLEVGIHMTNQLSALDLEFIYSQLRQYKAEGKSLLITRYTYDALALICDLALKNSLTATDEDERKEIGRKIRYSMNILKFFETFSLLICDESHQNLDAITRSIFGVGKLIEIPENEAKHMLAMMKPIVSNFPKSPSDAEIEALRKALARRYLELIPDLPKSAHEEVYKFWSQRPSPQPQILKSSISNKETVPLANLISITSHFLHDLLPEILLKRTTVDHTRSLYPQRKYEVPARNEQPSTAEHSDKYRTCAFTIKGNYDRGLSEDDIRFLMTAMLKDSETEKTQGFPSENTPSNLRFKEWTESTPLKGQYPRKLEDVLLSNEAVIASLHDVLSKKSEVIDYFLLKHAFVGVGTPSEELTCTTTDTASGFYGFVSFSATPREDLANPRCIKGYYRDLNFEKNVKKKWEEPQNSTVVSCENEEDFFKEMKRGKYLEETVLIDPRGFFKSPSKQVAKKWLEANPQLDGVLYFKQARSTDVNRDEKICLLKRDGKLLELCGSDIEKALKEHDLDWETLTLGTLYGPGQTESANIKQKKGAKACFFLGDGLTTSHAVQAIMRCRGFEILNQTVTTFASKALGRKIWKTSACFKEENASITTSTSSASASTSTTDKDEAPTIKKLFNWTDENQKVEEEKRIILNGFQEIHHAIAKKARDRLKRAHETDETNESITMDAVVAVHRQHGRGLFTRNPAEAHEYLAKHDELKESRKTLELYAQGIYQKFNYEIAYSSPVKDEVEKIIADVEKRIAMIASGYENASSKEIEQHLELNAHAHKQQQKVVPRPADPLSLKGVYGDLRVYSPEYLNMPRTLAKDAFQTKFLSDDLYLCMNYLRTAKLRDAYDPSPQFLKPIQYFTIVITPEGHFADVDSNDCNSSIQTDLYLCPEKVEDIKHTAFLVTAQGSCVQKGKGAVAPPQEKVEAIMNTPWFHNLAVDAALLRGRIDSPDALIPRIKKTGWKEFETLWNKIKLGLPNPENAQTQAFEKLKEKCRKENGDTAINS